MDNSIQAHQKELCNKLWAMANALRGNMEAYEFKNYILGMIFYYYLSDKTEKYMVNLLKDDGISYEEAWADPEYKEAVVEEALRDLGYVIEPQFLFRKMVKMVENRSFDIEFLQKAINSLMESTIGNDSQEDFDGLFSDMQLDSTKLGHTVKDRSSVMAKIISSLDEINFGVEDTKIDVLGNAYEYLIGQFAATAGKKAGEFVAKHKKGFLIVGLIAAVFLLFTNLFSSCSLMFQGASSFIAASTYPSQDEDMLAAPARCCCA